MWKNSLSTLCLFVLGILIFIGVMCLHDYTESYKACPHEDAAVIAFLTAETEELHKAFVAAMSDDVLTRGEYAQLRKMVDKHNINRLVDIQINSLRHRGYSSGKN